MTELILGMIVLALLGYVIWKDHHFSTERRELLNAVLSKNSIEFATANKISEPQEEKPEEPQPDYVSQDGLSDDEFIEAINKNNEENIN